MGEVMYRKIQDWVRQRYGFVPQPCWIAHGKALFGLPVRRAHNRSGRRRKPCPLERRQAIRSAFVHFGLLPD
jgi:hypothetical protein